MLSEDLQRDRRVAFRATFLETLDGVGVEPEAKPFAVLLKFPNSLSWPWALSFVLVSASPIALARASDFQELLESALEAETLWPTKTPEPAARVSFNPFDSASVCRAKIALYYLSRCLGI